MNTVPSSGAACGWRLKSLIAGVAAAAAALVLHQSAVATPGADGRVVAIRHVRLFDGDRMTGDATVLFSRGVILAAGPSVAPPPGATVIDGAGKTLIPGLIDAHVHMADSYTVVGGLALEQAAVYGVTTVLDLGVNNPGDVQEFRQRVKAGAYPQGADFFSAGPPATAPGGHAAGHNPNLTAPDQAEGWVDDRVAQGSDYIKMISETFQEHHRDVPTLSDETFAAVVKAAHERSLIVIAHTLQEARARRAVIAGVDGLVHISPYDDPSPDFGKFVKAHGVFQSTNLISYAPPSIKVALASDPALAPYMPGFMIAQLKAARPFPDASHAYSIKAFKSLAAAGVPILAGTDIGYPYAPLLHAELAIMTDDGGFTPLQALKSATSNTADAYHMPDRGRIRPGLRADLVLLDGDPSQTIRATRGIVKVWVRGVEVDRQAYQAKLASLPNPPGPGAPPPSAPIPAPAR